MRQPNFGEKGQVLVVPASVPVAGAVSPEDRHGYLKFLDKGM